jgi:hypothetical protein
MAVCAQLDANHDVRPSTDGCEQCLLAGRRDRVRSRRLPIR